MIILKVKDTIMMSIYFCFLKGKDGYLKEILKEGEKRLNCIHPVRETRAGSKSSFTLNEEFSTPQV